MSEIITSQSRRSFLHNGANVIALPFLASMLPTALQSANEKKSSISRLLWMSAGHGHMEDHFYPTEFGNFSDLKSPLAFGPIKNNFKNFTMISNFTNKQNKQPHEGSEALLTCADVVGFSGKARHNSISCDQVAASHLGSNTRYESLQLNCPTNKGGSNNGHGGVAISYKTDGSPMPGIHSPLDLYHKVFGGNVTKKQQLKILEQRKSIFDIMKFDAKTVTNKLSKDDKDKLEQYMTSIRDIELSLSREKKWINVPYPKTKIPAPDESLTGEKSIRMMFKMIIAAYQVDSTRVITYRMPDSDLLNSMSISQSPHTLSHYGTNATLHKLNLQRTTKWLQLYSDFIDQLKSSKDPLDTNGASIYDNSLVYFGGGLRTAHRTLNVPCLLTGGGFKGLTHGQHRKAENENTPLANLWLTMIQDAGAKVDSFADSSATVRSIYS